MEQEEAIWAAGVISSLGVMRNTKIMRKQLAGRALSYRLEVSSAKHPEVPQLLAKFVGIELKKHNRNYKEIPVFILWGEELSAFMRQIWPWLTNERKKEYLAMKRASDATIIDEGKHPDDY